MSPEPFRPEDEEPASSSATDPAVLEEAWKAALSYLSYRIRSRRELERHLRKRGYERTLVERTLGRCEQLGLVDDRAFAAAFARDRIRLRPRGVTRLEAELFRKGVARDDAREGIRAAFEEEQVTELHLLEAVARSRWRRLGSVDRVSATRRLFDHLVRSGFPTDEVQRVVTALADEAERRSTGRVRPRDVTERTDRRRDR